MELDNTTPLTIRKFKLFLAEISANGSLVIYDTRIININDNLTEE